METEKWLPVPNYVGLYDVSSHGRVRSLRPRATSNRGGSNPRDTTGILKPGYNSSGYPHVALFDASGRRRTTKVHVIVLEAFVSPRPPGAVAGHLNAVRDDNRLENLRWLSVADNIAQRDNDGNTPRGEKHGRAKLTVDAVRRIRAARGLVTQEKLASLYGVSPASISYIQSRRNWAHVIK